MYTKYYNIMLQTFLEKLREKLIARRLRREQRKSRNCLELDEVGKNTMNG